MTFSEKCVLGFESRHWTWCIKVTWSLQHRQCNEAAVLKVVTCLICDVTLWHHFSSATDQSVILHSDWCCAITRCISTVTTVSLLTVDTLQRGSVPCVCVCVGEYDRLCPGGPGFRPNGVSAVLEGNTLMMLVWHWPQFLMFYSLSTELNHFRLTFASL